MYIFKNNSYHSGCDQFEGFSAVAASRVFFSISNNSVPPQPARVATRTLAAGESISKEIKKTLIKLSMNFTLKYAYALGYARGPFRLTL